MDFGESDQVRAGEPPLRGGWLGREWLKDWFCLVLCPFLPGHGLTWLVMGCHGLSWAAMAYHGTAMGCAVMTSPLSCPVLSCRVSCSVMSWRDMSCHAMSCPHPCEYSGHCLVFLLCCVCVVSCFVALSRFSRFGSKYTLEWSGNRVLVLWPNIAHQILYWIMCSASCLNPF